MQKEYGFGTIENLLLAALNGILYTIGSVYGGKFAQKYGSILSIGIGISGLLLSLLCGGLIHALPIQVAVFAFWTISICFIWPAIEAIVSEHETENLSTMVGIYNMTWAGASALAYFTTGILLEKLGMQSIFWLPFGLHLFQLSILFPLAIKFLRKDKRNMQHVVTGKLSKPPEYSRNFLHMAWLANPFSYVAINTLIPLMPSIAQHLGLSTGLAGVICSIWMFARLATFFTLWKWSGWHYRLRWIVGAFALMISSYAAILLAGSVFTILLAQIGFGLSIGIIYYSSLFYSMNASDEKGAHGGLHEAMIGTGLFIGPAFSAACQYMIPSAANGNTGMSVNALLLLGFTGLLWKGKFKLPVRKPNLEDQIHKSESPIH
jgi:MFS family permease